MLELSIHEWHRIPNRRLSTNTVHHTFNFASKLVFYIRKVTGFYYLVEQPGNQAPFFYLAVPWSEAGVDGKKADTAWERGSFCCVQRLTHQVCQFYDLSCWRSGKTWESFSCAFVHWAELQQRKKENNYLTSTYTSLRFTWNNMGRKGGHIRWWEWGEGGIERSSGVNLPDPCGGSQTWDISRNFSSSCIMVRFDRYCFTLRDIMDCVTNKRNSIRKRNTDFVSNKVRQRRNLSN